MAKEIAPKQSQKDNIALDKPESQIDFEVENYNTFAPSTRSAKLRNKSIQVKNFLINFQKYS